MPVKLPGSMSRPIFRGGLFNFNFPSAFSQLYLFDALVCGMAFWRLAKRNFKCQLRKKLLYSGLVLSGHSIKRARSFLAVFNISFLQEYIVIKKKIQ